MSNKLKGLRVYTAGSIDAAPDNGVGWRERLTPVLQEKFGLVVINPLNSPIKEHKENKLSDIAYRHQLAKEERYDEIAEIVWDIRHNDLRLTDISDFCVAFIDTDIVMCGTIEEVTRMNMSKKPILLVVKQGKSKCPLWFFGMIPHTHVFSNFDELTAYLSDVDSGKVIDNRWVFHNL